MFWTNHVNDVHVTGYICDIDMIWTINQYMWHDLYVTCFVHAWHTSFEIWLYSFMCDMTHFYMLWLIHAWYDSFIRWITHSYVPWRIHAWHDSCVFMWHDSFICKLTNSYVTWLINTWCDLFTCDMIHSHVTRHCHWPQLCSWLEWSAATHCNKLQHTTPHCNTHTTFAYCASIALISTPREGGARRSAASPFASFCFFPLESYVCCAWYIHV